jgi:polyhydroxybutyrate depolymerase
MTAVAANAERHGQKAVLAAILVLISLPALLALTEAVSFYATNRSNGTIVSAGIEREYLLYVPRSYDPAKPTPLVISLHGGAMWPAAQMEIDRWNRVAEEHGFLLVYPSGVSGRGPRSWRSGAERGPMRDVPYISELIDTLRASYNIDSTRVYANGLSNGGGMAFKLACTLSDRIAAVGMVGTAIFLPWSGCTDQRPVPMILFHGTADRAALYEGGTSWVAPNLFPSIPGWTTRYAVRNRCEPTPVKWKIAPDVTRIEYPRCAENASVVLYRIEDGGHTWPGGKPLPEWFVGRTSSSIDATAEMWNFFREHPLGQALTTSRYQ